MVQKSFLSSRTALHHHHHNNVWLFSSHDQHDNHDALQQQQQQQRIGCNRRGILWNLPLAAVVTAALSDPPRMVYALVKGVSPPPKSSKPSDRPKCTNVEECQAMAERKEQQEREEADANATPTLTTPTGIRYRDLQVGSGTTAVQPGDDVTIYYKVLKLGKRSYDGLSGEGTVVFSRGYGYEDDETEARQKSFTTTVGAYSNIAALNDAIVGMKEKGGLRRFVVQPDKGWRRPGQACDGGPGGKGVGGELKTDYVVVPTATMVATEACLDVSKQPFPVSYGQQRRMAQRFDQSLIMEVEVVKIAPGSTSYLE